MAAVVSRRRPEDSRRVSEESRSPNPGPRRVPKTGERLPKALMSIKGSLRYGIIVGIPPTLPYDR